jgi:hypothetical protein
VPGQALHPQPNLPVLKIFRKRRFPDREVSGRLRATETSQPDEIVSPARENPPVQVALPETKRTKLKNSAFSAKNTNPEQFFPVFFVKNFLALLSLEKKRYFVIRESVFIVY